MLNFLFHHLVEQQIFNDEVDFWVITFACRKTSMQPWAFFGRFHQTLGYYTPSLLHKQSSFHRMHSSGRVFDSFIPPMDGEDQVTMRCCQILWNPSRLLLGFGILRKSEPFVIRVWRARGERWRPGFLRTCFPLSVLLFEGAGCVRGGSAHPRSPQWCMSASTAIVRLCNFEIFFV